jgi:hypothetical protein
LLDYATIHRRDRCRVHQGLAAALRSCTAV